MAQVLLEWLDPNRGLVVRWAPTARLISDFRAQLTHLVLDGVAHEVPAPSHVMLAPIPAPKHGRDAHRVVVAGFFEATPEIAARLEGRGKVPADYRVAFVDGDGTRMRPEADYSEVDRPPLVAELLDGLDGEVLSPIY